MYISLLISRNIEEVQYGYIISKTHMVILYLVWDTNPLRFRGDGEGIVEREVPYPNTIKALIYLAKYVRPDTIFGGDLVRVQSSKRYKVCVRNILRYTKAQKVLINSIRKIKIGPWCDIRIMAKYLIPTVPYQRLDLLEIFSERSLQNRLKLSPSSVHSASITRCAWLHRMIGHM